MGKRPSQIKVQYRGGFKGPYIDIQILIERKVKLDVIDFCYKDSNVRDCDKFCYMQIRVGGRMCVTWQASKVLSDFLADCKAEDEDTITMTRQQMEENEDAQLNVADHTDVLNYPIKECIIYVNADRAYYLMDAPDDALDPDDEEFDRLVNDSTRSRNNYNYRRNR